MALPGTPPAAPVAVPVVGLTAAVVRSWRGDLSMLPGPADDAGRVELLCALEELNSAAAAVQARVTVAFEASQRAVQVAAGMNPRDVGRGIGAQVGSARRDSPARGARHLGLARVLLAELPHTLAALSAGETTEWRATLVARETGCLSRTDRRVVDAELAARPGRLGALGDRATEVAARTIAYRLDPYAATRRARKAEADRRVSLRPAPDTMSNLTGLLPVRQGVAAFAALTRHADALRAAGDPRTRGPEDPGTRGQIMADTLVERVTGQATADAVPVEVQILIRDQSLLHPDPPEPDLDEPDLDEPYLDEPDLGADGVGEDGVGEEPAHVPGYGPVPVPLARSWIRDTTAQVWLRRLYTHPETGVLVAMESRRRTFTGKLRAFLVARDQVCRTPWCDAPIRHVDHLTRAADSGPTTAENGQGLCTACNYAREAPGWTLSPDRETVRTRTPTGHHHTSSPPRQVRPQHRPSRLNVHCYFHAEHLPVEFDLGA